MKHEMTVILIVGVAAVAILVAAILLQVRDAKKNKHAYVTPTPEEIFNTEPTVISLHGEIVDVCCRVGSIGIKQPKTVKEFAVALRSDNGEVYPILVPEEIYDAFEIGQVGTLTLIDGVLDTFVLDGGAQDEQKTDPSELE